jgi:hypothetical protein
MLDTIEDMLKHMLICHHTPDPKQSNYWDLLDTVKPLLRMSNLPCDLTPPAEPTSPNCQRIYYYSQNIPT